MRKNFKRAVIYFHKVCAALSIEIHAAQVPSDTYMYLHESAVRAIFLYLL